MQNSTTIWATAFVHALAASGLDAVCIAPGSRSTPLTLAFDAHPDIEVFVHLDERSAGFFALGRALATGKPVALVCTSGTAVANFFPALIEANMSHVPLLILTADRPPELRHSGANQTIDQVKIYGDQVLWAVDLDTPQASAPEVALRNVAQTAARAYATANGLRQGPVHVNLPFRKPLEPDNQAVIQLVSLSVAQHDRGQIAPSAGQVAQLQGWVEQYPNGLIVCGPRCPEGDFPQALVAFSQATGYPILADPLSGVRFGSWVNDAVLGGYESWLTQNQDPPGPVPDIVIRFGQVPTSKWLNAYLERISPAVRLHIRQNGVWADDSQRTTHFWQCDEVALVGQVSRNKEQETRNKGQWAEVEEITWGIVARFMDEHFFDATAVSLVLDSLPNDLNLVMGNSLPIRHLDQFGRPRKNAWRVFGNRGASGIDGNTSTAVGIASANPNRPTLLITGDVTFYHDLNGLLAINHNQIHNISIVLLNNGGGGIFNRLPVANHEPAFTPLFKTPHHLDFAHAAALFGLAHVRVHGRADLQTALASDWLSRPTILEIMTDNKRDEQLRRDLVRQLRELTFAS